MFCPDCFVCPGYGKTKTESLFEIFISIGMFISVEIFK